MRRILLITDAWHPQTNGVVTTLENLVRQANENGDSITVVHPDTCKIRFPFPFYREIIVGLPNRKRVEYMVTSTFWDHIHVATPEGWIGSAFAKALNKYSVPFSASCHTKFPEFIKSRISWFPIELGWRWMKQKYNGAGVILVPTESMKAELENWKFGQPIQVWSRGIDRNVFDVNNNRTTNRPKILLCVSRVSHEKGLDDFCNLEIPDTEKILVGDGPYLKTLKKRYPDVQFVGKKTGKELAEYYQHADVFVFPSKNDTFGVVMLESIACGAPVAAYPVTGPVDIVESGTNGFLHSNLQVATENALLVPRTTTYNSSLKWTWQHCYKQFSDCLL